MTIGLKMQDEGLNDRLGGTRTDERLEWIRPDDHPALTENELHLWRVRTDERGAPLDFCVAQLGRRQHERAERMRHANYRERYMRAQAGLRRVLAGYLACTPAEIEFCHGPAGKPYLQTDSLSLSFNLSTTGDLALIGVRLGAGPERELGVDCEQIRPRVDIFGVAERMMDAQIVEELRATPEPNRLERFYRAWTALEADAKCDGRGLFRQRALEAEPPVVMSFIPEEGYIASVASPRLPLERHWRAFELN